MPIPDALTLSPMFDCPAKKNRKARTKWSTHSFALSGNLSMTRMRFFNLFGRELTGLCWTPCQVFHNNKRKINMLTYYIFGSLLFFVYRYELLLKNDLNKVMFPDKTHPLHETAMFHHQNGARNEGHFKTN